MFKFINSLINKNDPSSTHSFLTIIVVFAFLLFTAGVLFWKPSVQSLGYLLAAITSLVGVQSFTEHRKNPIKKEEESSKDE